MDYNNDQVIKAFKIYSKLAAEGLGEKRICGSIWWMIG